MDLLRTVLTFGSVFLLTGLLTPLVSVLSIGKPERADPILRFWARSILLAAGVRVEVQGLENLPATRCVIVSNHQSHFDALVILSKIRRHLRFVAKTELFRIPLFGLALRATGNIEVDRTGSDRDREKLRQAIAAVHQRVNILFFAEGTRSLDGKLQPFKRGAALLALQAQVPLVPIAVAGTREILPKGSKWVRGRVAILRIGRAISTEGLTPEDRDRLTEIAQKDVQLLLNAANDALAGA